MINKLIPLIALSAISLPAAAADKSSFYGSLGGGAYRLKAEGFNETAPTAMFLGGFDLNERVAFEASYSRLFESSEQIQGLLAKVDGNVWDVSTRLSMPMGQRFSPYGRIGWSYLDTSLLVSDGQDATRINDYDDAFSWGVGTGFKLNDRYSLSGEYSRVLVNNADFDRMSLNLNVRFGSR